MISLIGTKAYRVLGFGSLVPGSAPAMGHYGAVDVVVHDSYESEASRMIVKLEEEAGTRALKTLLAHVAITDQAKLEWFTAAGFNRIGLVPGTLMTKEMLVDVAVFEKKLRGSQ